jgi:hypothetical protein
MKTIYIEKPLNEIISFDNFKFKEYYNGEKDLLAPQLVKLGYTILRWYSEESDSFGPLSRACICKKDGISYKFYYG